nr:DUF4105 domain-containing protein [uncultured Arsenicibacter sp.]
MLTRVLRPIILLLAGCLPGMAAGIRLSPSATVSVLTCAPGNDAYSLFGHTALQVEDQATGLNQVYNFGTFDSRQAGFPVYFVRGSLQYWLSAAPFNLFLYSYQLENRSIYQQTLTLTPTEVQTLYDKLEVLLQSPARYYRYQFFTDNCSTRPLLLLSQSLASPIGLDSGRYTTRQTHRQLIAPYTAPHPWIATGINLALGRPADQPLPYRQTLFLPDALKEALARSRRHGQPFVGQSRLLFTSSTPIAADGGVLVKPWHIWAGLLILTIFTRLRLPHVYRLWRTTLLVTTGLFGCLLAWVTLWSLHVPLQQNYQLLWLLPTHLFLAFIRSGAFRQWFAITSSIVTIAGLSLGTWLYYASLMPSIWLLQVMLLVLQLSLVKAPADKL